MTARELIDKLASLPPETPVLVMGFGGNDITEPMTYCTPSVGLDDMIEYDCDGGHLGLYDVRCRDNGLVPKYAVSKSEPFKVVLLYPQPFRTTSHAADRQEIQR